MDKTETLIEVKQRLCADSGLDMETTYFVLDVYIEQTIELIKAVEASFQNQDFTEIASMMHKLKGSSGNVRANRMMALAIETEQAALEGNYEALMLNLDIMKKIIEKYAYENKMV